MGYEFMGDDVERDDVFPTWGYKESGNLVASSVLRDDSSGDDAVHNSSGGLCGDVIKDEGAPASA